MAPSAALREHFSILVPEYSCTPKVACDVHTVFLAPEMVNRLLSFLLPITMCLLLGCANISTPSGGKRDTKAPVLVSVSPRDSMLNTRVTKVVLQFDEYVTVNDVAREIEISPLLRVPPTVTAINKHVTLKIADSLLDANTTYRITFGKAVRDVHEGNAFEAYAYTFSTGSYFDSLQLRGNVVNALTGMPDTVGVIVSLYEAAENDTAVIKKRPRYKVRPDSRGQFVFSGLPARHFRIYALKDDNTNLTYDGGAETIAFNDSLLLPADSAANPVTLRLFTEKNDTAMPGAYAQKTSKKSFRDKGTPVVADTAISYVLNVDTSNVVRRTFDVSDSLKLTFSRPVQVYPHMVSMTYDSAGAAIPFPVRVNHDSMAKGVVFVVARFRENTVYRLSLSEGFAADTAGLKAVSGAYRFRTLGDEDYGRIKVNLPAKYGTYQAGKRPGYLLALLADGKDVSVQPVTDTVVNFTKLRPANYTFRIIVDKNGNGKWDTGDLLARQQPEEVVPSAAAVPLKSGWDNTVDFVQSASPAKDKKIKNR